MTIITDILHGNPRTFMTVSKHACYDQQKFHKPFMYEIMWKNMVLPETV
jgi:hypothetical protein